MDVSLELRRKTEQVLQEINFGELNETWIESVIVGEFADVEENDIDAAVLFSNDAVKTLDKLAEICIGWCQIENGDESSVSDDNDFPPDQPVLWKILDEMDLNVKYIQCMIYLFCFRAFKKDSDADNVSLGLTCARLYFSCLRVPGSGAYSVYHPNLFNLCIDCLPDPDFLAERKLDISYFKEYETALQALLPVLKEFHLGDDTDTLEHAVKKLVEITTFETQNRIDFKMGYQEIIKKQRQIRKYASPLVITVLAFEAFYAVLATDLNGDMDKNYLLILSYLCKHILCSKAKKTQAVPQRVLIIKDNIVEFICHNLKTKEYSLEASQIIIKRLCVNVTDRTEIRNIASAAILTILFAMPAKTLAEMVEWFLLLVDSAETKDRVFALDTLSQLLSSTSESNANIPEFLREDSFNVPVIFSILTRCDDVSSNVRTKALMVLSQNMKSILRFLDKTKDKTTFKMENSEDIDDLDLDANGNHRYFWYGMESFRERLNEIAAILQRRVEDCNVTARKAALLALENLIVFDPTYITEENLKFFDFATNDHNILVRKQVMQSLSVILDAYPGNFDIQECWIRCILPLINNTDQSVQDKALSVLEEQFLQKIYSSKQSDREGAFSLLKLLTTGDFLAYHKFLQKSFGFWKSQKALRPQTLIQLEKYIGNEWEECIWFYISCYAVHSNIPAKISNLCLEQFEKLNDIKEYPSYLVYILKILGLMYQSLQPEKLESFLCTLSNNLNNFDVPVDLIPGYVETLYKFMKHQGKLDEFNKFSSSVMQECEKHLESVIKTKSFSERPSEELLAKQFCTMKELCHFNSSNITKNVISLLKTYSGCVQPPKPLSKIMTPGLKAHAFAALGKISLQDEIVAKELLDLFAKELFTSKYDTVRNNILIILIEMCKRYTSFADKYVPLICQCFKDKVYIIRLQTVVMVVNLLQEEFIKFRGHLFFCCLSTLVDKKEAIQELGRYCLSQLLRDKKKNLFAEHFIDSIFVFNNFSPPDNETLSQIVKDLEKFSLPGEGKREDRMILYKFMLDSMQFEDRAYLVRSICDIFSSIAEQVYTLNQTTECIVRDCFAILVSKEIRSFNVENYDLEEGVENNYSEAELAARKIIIIDPVVPVVLNLDSCFKEAKSDMMADLILFLKELLHDYKDAIPDLLCTKRELLRNLELAIRTDAEKERVEKRDKRLKQTSSEPTEQRVTDGIHTRTLAEVDEVVEAVTQRTEATPRSTPRMPPHLSRLVKKIQGSAHKTSQHLRSSTSQADPHQNVPSTSSASDSRLASTPRVVLTPIRNPLSANLMNVNMSPIEPMELDSPESDTN